MVLREEGLVGIVRCELTIQERLQVLQAERLILARGVGGRPHPVLWLTFVVV